MCKGVIGGPARVCDRGTSGMCNGAIGRHGWSNRETRGMSNGSCITPLVG